MKKQYSLKKCYAFISDKIGRVNRNLWRNKHDRKRLINENFTIFSQNCIGSVIYHDLGLEFLSPTINMLFEPNDFVRFLENPNWYIEQDIEFTNDSDYICGKIGGGVYIKFIHYHSKQEVINSWQRRKERINWSNIFVIACDKGMDYEYIKRFDKLDRYKNKIIFTGKDMPEIKSSVYTAAFCDGADARLLNFANPLGKRYYQNYIDYVEWLNG